jgi:energy-coupling factor transporter ATP-binding protein EcfA2
VHETKKGRFDVERPVSAKGGKKPIPARAYRIASVFVEGLFGIYTYDINVGGTSSRPGPLLLILYGDNGSGKTTILQLVYHLLGREDDRGHRTYLARVPFRRLRITLDPPATVEAYRTGSEQVGAYELRITREGNVLVEAEALVDADLSVKSSATGTAEQRRRWDRFLKGLADLDLAFFFLRDDRRSDQPRLSERSMPPEGVPEEAYRQALLLQRHRDREGPDLRLEKTIEGLERWIRDEALKRTNIGEAGTRVVYADIAKRIAASRELGGLTDSASEPLVPSLLELESRSKPYASLGLVSPPKLTEIVATLESSPPDTRSLIASVISPYVESLAARLNAQKDLMELTTLFLNRINEFFRNKKVTYTLARGFAIVTPQGQTLEPAQLSSGERQLFGLLAQVITARPTATIFLIDEPEISLNVKWQRVLVDTLLELVRGTDAQFILATHSVELLTSHRGQVCRLVAPREGDERPN